MKITIKQSPEPLRIEPALLTISQVCELLNISRAEFYRLNASGKFAPLQVDLCRKVLYLKTEIESWLQTGCPHHKQWQIQKRKNAIMKTKSERKKTAASTASSVDKADLLNEKPAGTWYWKLYETTLKVFVDAVLERFWPKPN